MSDRSGGSACILPCQPFCVRYGSCDVLPARGMVRVVGEEPAIQTFPPLTLFCSGWRAEWQSGWVVRVPFQITSPCVRSADYCTLRTFLDYCSPMQSGLTMRGAFL